MRALVVAALAVLLSGFADAGTACLRLDGPMVQGGLIQGLAPPGARVALDGRPLPVAADGLFLFGFGHDAPPRALLTATCPDGREVAASLQVGRRAYDVQRIDGLPARQVTPSAEDMRRIRRESRLIHVARARDSDAAWFREGFVWPVEGIVSGVYGSRRILNGQPRRPHLGIDIAAPRGTSVVAASRGVVALARRGMFFTGGTVIVDHGSGINSIYSHLSEIDVEPGDRVAGGERIGAVGSTGRSTGPHLDWRVNLFQTRLDPMLLVGPMPR